MPPVMSYAPSLTVSTKLSVVRLVPLAVFKLPLKVPPEIPTLTRSSAFALEIGVPLVPVKVPPEILTSNWPCPEVFPCGLETESPT